MFTLLFFPATWNLAETTRTIEVAKACSDLFKIVFATYGGPFENLIEEENFEMMRLKPRLNDKKIEHIYEIDQGKRRGSFFSLEETRQRVKNEVSVIEVVFPVLKKTCLVLTFS